VPTYEYRCQSCHHELEAFQRIKDAPLTDCPACHERKLERLISATSFQLKGGGWYKDLYSSSKSAGNPPKSNKAA
jgi:putative FmdB family regulatory protein